MPRHESGPEFETKFEDTPNVSVRSLFYVQLERAKSTRDPRRNKPCTRITAAELTFHKFVDKYARRTATEESEEPRVSHESLRGKKML